MLRSGGGKISSNGKTHTIEDNDHYFMNCSKFDNIRNVMIQRIKKIINGYPNIKISTKLLLGFDDSVKFTKRVKTELMKIRKKINIEVCKYIRESHRFDLK